VVICPICTRTVTSRICLDALPILRISHHLTSYQGGDARHVVPNVARNVLQGCMVSNVSDKRPIGPYGTNTVSPPLKTVCKTLRCGTFRTASAERIMVSNPTRANYHEPSTGEKSVGNTSNSSVATGCYKIVFSSIRVFRSKSTYDRRLHVMCKYYHSESLTVVYSRLFGAQRSA
jgi:hypothetical protein